MNEAESKVVTDELYEITKNFLEEKWLEDNYGIGMVQAIRHSEGAEINTAVSLTWGGEKGLYWRVGIEVAEGLFNLAIQIIEDIAKDKDTARTTIMALFANALKQARQKENTEEPAAE